MQTHDITAEYIDKEREKLERSGKFRWAHWMVILFSFILTFSAWYFSKNQMDEKIKNQFDREVSNVVEMLSERLQKYEDGLWGAVGAIQAQGGTMTYPNWVKFSEALRLDIKYPGINGIGVINYLKPKELDSFLKRQTRLRPGYTVHPKHKQNILLPITYIEPVLTNHAAVGLDIAHESNRFMAAIKARDTGLAQITGPITLVQDSGKTPGFLFYAPYYRDNLDHSLQQRQDNISGFVYAPFVVKKLMAGTLAEESRHIGIKIYDSQDVLYDEHQNTHEEFDKTPLFQTIQQVPLYGRIWTFDFRSTLSFRSAINSNQPLIILIGGITIDSLLIILFFILTRTNKKAVQYACQVNQILQQKADVLEKNNKNLEQLSFLVSHDLSEPLRGIRTLSAFIEEDEAETLKGQSFEHFTKIKNLVAKMETLLKELMNYAALINRPAPEYEETCNFKSIVMDICALNAFDYNNIRFDTDVTEFRGQKFIIKTILNNLISNAFKYGASKNGEHTIIVASKIMGTYLEISVQDFGPGISPQDQKHIFEIFRKLHSNKNINGIGVGLAIVEKLANNYGEKVWVECPSAGGTIFKFTWQFEPKTSKAA